MHEAKFRKWSHRTQFAWAKLCSLERTQMTKVQILFAWRSFGARLALAWANSNDESLGMFAWRSLERTGINKIWAATRPLAWAKWCSLERSIIWKFKKFTQLLTLFHPKTQFWSPITQNESLQLFTGSICNIALKTTQNYAINNKIINIFTKYPSF